MNNFGWLNKRHNVFIHSSTNLIDHLICIQWIVQKKKEKLHQIIYFILFYVDVMGFSRHSVLRRAMALQVANYMKFSNKSALNQQISDTNGRMKSEWKKKRTQRLLAAEFFFYSVVVVFVIVAIEHTKTTIRYDCSKILIN